MHDKYVLIVTYYWPPAGGAGVQRMLKLSKFLPEFGIKPIILTVSNPTYPIIDETLSEEISDDLEIYKAHSIEPFAAYAKMAGKSVSEISKPTTAISNMTSGSLLGKAAAFVRGNVFIPDGRVGWVPAAISKAKEIIRKKNPVAIITTGPPHSTHFVGRSIQHTFGLPWIADFRDPWVDIHYNQVMPRTSAAVSFDKKLEQSVITRANEIITTSESLASLFSDRYKRNIKTITNGYDPDDFIQDIEQIHFQKKSITIRHIGTLPEPSIPFGLLNALQKLPSRDHLHFEFIGNVHNKMKSMVDEFALNDVITFVDYLPYKEAAEKMQEADVLLLLIPDVAENPESIIPGKVFNYLGARRVILQIGSPTGDSAHILSQCGHSLIFNHSDEDQMQHFFSDLTPNRLNTLLTSLDDQNLDRYSRKSQAEELAGIITNVVDQ